MHIGSVSVFDGPAPEFERLRDMIEGKLPQVRRYRQVVRQVPLDLGRPVWADDPYFNIGYHLRHTALPSPGDMSQLCALVGRVMAQQLDRARPLWEMWVVEGLPGGEWAIVSKVHHCMVDGISGSELLGLILDSEPDPLAVEPLPWSPERAPTGLDLAWEALGELATSTFELGRLARSRTRPLRRAAGQARRTLSALGATGAVVGRRSASSLNGPLGPHRRWVPAEIPVEDVKVVRAQLGGTFNDVILATVTNGFRQLLLSMGESTERPVRTMVPVSVGPRDDHGRPVGDGALANRISAVFADLPVGIEDPVERLRAVSRQMSGLKQSHQALAGEALTSVAGFAPPMLLSLAGRLGTRLPQDRVNTITTNVPGPQVPLYALGRRMRRTYPFVPLGMRLRVGVAIFSYDGMVTFGVTSDWDMGDAAEVLAHGISEGAAGLVAAAHSTRPGRRRRTTAHPVVVDLRTARPPADRRLPVD
jgi:WS/DGAT/MGAT family acyltransferase